ncbi:DUF58 domain-containing protein [Blastococcus xanthinilyticus]|uniref:Uncharacterized protein (DUF58 family) n=1 Tax=Blastococcus xanthinilyticus TaxID=1564164 RepID=A0A5S5CWY6_9ACTN|nr:DUF58 domain-containing protein [Blastococcus xanthinilyticus]TYP88321.1 uncharacterized protein (DUF58 family) [Blastococcus xanthinilyticus]
MAAPRRALAGLTSRGRCLVGGGLALGLTGAVLGERALVQLAGFVLALPLLAALSVARRRSRVSTRRTVTPARVARGGSAEVVLELQNTDTRRAGVWLLSEQLPGALGRAHRFTVSGLAAGAATKARYQVTGRYRGRYQVGPLQLRVVDPFGLVERTTAGGDTAPLTVVPRVRPLGPGGPGGGRGRGGEGARRAIAVSGDDDVTVREYRQGDDLRKVHWRATARTGELMVRLEERPWRAQGTLLLDTRARAHLVAPEREGVPQVPGPPGDRWPPADSLEWLVEAAASVGVALAEQGADLRVVTAAGELPPAPGRRGLGADELLDRLATVGASRASDLSATVAAACRVAGNGPLICLLGAVGPDDVADLVQQRGGPVADVAVLLDITGWADAAPARARRAGPAAEALRGQREQAAAMLAGAGWRVTTAEAGQDVADVWSRLGGIRLGAPA